MTSLTPAPAPCPHSGGATVHGYLGHQPDADQPDVDEHGTGWWLLGDAPAELATWKGDVALGTCPACGTRVVTVHAWDAGQPWTVEQGHGGTTVGTPWVALARPHEGPQPIDMDAAVEHAQSVIEGEGVDLGPEGSLIVRAALVAALTGNPDPHMELLRRMRAAGTI